MQDKANLLREAERRTIRGHLSAWLGFSMIQALSLHFLPFTIKIFYMFAHIVLTISGILYSFL